MIVAAPLSSDAELLAAVARDGDRDALGQLARRYVNFVYAAAARRLADCHAAEDVTQAVFLVLARRAGSVRAPALTAWLHRTTQYAAANANRGARRRRHHESAAARPEAVMPYVLPEPDPLLPMLDEAIDSLGRRDRVAVIERYLLGRDFAAVGVAIGLSPASAQKRVERAVGKLRKFFVRAGVPAGTVAVTTALAAAVPSAANAAPPTLAIAVAHAAPANAVAIASQGAFTMSSSFAIKFATGLAVVAAVGGGGYTAVQYASGPAAASMPARPTPDASYQLGLAASNEVPLRNGVVIKLLAIGQTAKDGRKTWWKPDGSPAPAPARNGNGSIANSPADSVVREFVYQVDQPDGVAVDFSVVGSAGHAGGGSAGMGPTDGYNMVSPVPDRPAVVRFDVAAGPWTRRARARIFANQAGPVRNGTVEFGPPKAATDLLTPHTAVTVTLPEPAGVPKTQWQLVATDSAGREWMSSGGGQTRTNGKRQLDFDIRNMKATDVVELTLRSRPYDEWIEFRDVSVHAGGATSPAAAGSDDGKPFAATLQDGTRPQIVAFGDTRTGEWWQPDGSPMDRPSYAPQIDAADMPKDRTVRPVWLIATCDRRGSYFWNYSPRGDMAKTSHYTKGLTDGGRYYVGYLLELKDEQATGDVSLVVPSRPPVDVAMSVADRGTWSPAVAARQTISGAGDVVVWMPQDEPAEPKPFDIEAGASFRAFLPNDATGTRSVDYIIARRDGKPAMYRTMYPASSERPYNFVRTGVPLADIRSLGVRVQFMDESVAFTNLSLRPGQRTRVRITPSEPKPLK